MLPFELKLQLSIDKENRVLTNLFEFEVSSSKYPKKYNSKHAFVFVFNTLFIYIIFVAFISL